jgi:esterase/lipase
MFHYWAAKHERTNLARSLERQKRIADKNIEFGWNTSLAFAVRDCEDNLLDFLRLSSHEMAEGYYFSPMLEPKPCASGEGYVIFQSDLATGSEKNDEFKCVITDGGSKDHALVVFHHWYARNRYSSFAKFFASRGITVVEATLPYHFERGSDDCSEENFFNANVGQTLHAFRQAVLDGRKVVRWLKSEGYRKVSVAGMCLGGTVAGLIAAEEAEVDNAVLIVSPGSPADLIWTSETMQLLRGRIEPFLSRDDLRRAWGLIDLESRASRLGRFATNFMLLFGKHDNVVPIYSANRFMSEFKRSGYSPRVRWLDCGHSSISVQPYGMIAAWEVLRFLRDKRPLSGVPDDIRDWVDDQVISFAEGVPFTDRYTETANRYLARRERRLGR